MIMNFKAVIFDLDGTLLDTIEDLADSMNFVLSRLGCPGHGIPDYKIYVGNRHEKTGLQGPASRLIRKFISIKPSL